VSCKRRTAGVGAKLAAICVAWLGIMVRSEVALAMSAPGSTCRVAALTTINHNKEKSHVESVFCRQALRHLREEPSVSRPESDYYGFYGQKTVIRALYQEIEGAKLLGECCPHTLLRGGSGLGKTHLARAIAAHRGTNLHEMTGGREVNLVKLGRTAQNWSAHDIVFLDEAHSLRPEVVEALYRVIDERMAPKVTEDAKGKLKVDGEAEVAPVTIIIASDRSGKLRRALVKRMGEEFTLLPYSAREMAFIIRSYATKLGMLLSTQAPGAIVPSCQGIPRIARRRLESMRRIFAGADVSTFTKTHVRRFLALKGFDEHFRTPLQQEYMARLAGYSRHRASIGTLATALHLGTADIRFEVEPDLVTRGLVEIDRKGRWLTPEGLAMVDGARKEDTDAS